MRQPLETQRLLIRPFDQSDWQQVYEYTSDPAVMAYMPEGLQTAEQTQQFLSANMGEDAKALAIVNKAEHTLIGHMFFHLWFAPQTYEIGWVLHRQHHGKGYATEAALALLQHGFEQLGLHRIIATCQPENIPSYRVMEKLGMRREGHFQQCIYRDDGTWWSEYFYAMLRQEWFALQA